jgi:PAS domain S-box-containing protein
MSLLVDNQGLCCRISNPPSVHAAIANWCGTSHSGRILENMQPSARSALLRYGFAVLVTILAVLIRIPLSSVLGEDVPFILFFPAVTVSAWFGGVGPGLVTTLLSTLAATYFFIEPINVLAITNIQDAVRLIFFAVGSTFISWICGSLRSANRRTSELLKLHDTNVTAQLRLAAMVESSDDAIIGKSLQGIITSWNTGAERIYGYTSEEVVGRHVSLLASREHLIEMEQILEKIRRGERVGHLETTRVRKDGAKLEISLSVSPIKDSYGKTIGASTIARDITSRKRRERARQFLAEVSTTLASSLEYENTLATVAQLAVPDFADWCSVDMVGDDGRFRRLAVAHIDPDKVAWAHDLHERYPPDPNAPIGLYNILRTGQSEFYADVTDEMLVQIACDDEHLDVLRKIGFCSAVLVPLKTRNKTLGVLSFVNAESGRHHSLEDLALAEDLANRAALAVDNARLFRVEQGTRISAERTSDRLARLQDVTSALSQALTPQEVGSAVIEQGTKSLDAMAGTVAVINHSAQEMEIVVAQGFPEELTAKWERFPLSTRVALADAARDKVPVLIESISEWEHLYPTLGPLTSMTGCQAAVAFPLMVKGRAIGALGLAFLEKQKFSDDDRAYMFALAHQCAQALERARLYETEQQLRKEAEEASRIKDEFLATVSHELRTPLTSIVGWSSMLRMGDFDKPSMDRAIETIERNAKAQKQIIEDLLDVSRIITGKLRLEGRPTQLDSLITSAIDAIRPSAETKSIEIKASLEAGAGLVWGDAARLQQVLWNIFANAVKFNRKQGSIAVALKRVDSHAQLSVSDTGQGISPEFLPWVFDRFRQADGSTTREHGGLGLGLAIVRHIVELHGGEVYAESLGVGKGSTFTIILPLLAVQGSKQPSGIAGQAREARASNKVTATLNNIRVLVVDDEPDARGLLAELLERSGAKAMAVGSTVEALEAIASFKPDVLMSDIGMPGEDGFSLIRRVRALAPERGGATPALALTAYARDEDRLRALSAGFQEHLAKPVNAEELVLMLGTLARTKDRQL